MTAEEENIKERVISIIKTFRGLTLLSGYDVRINDLTEVGNNYVVTGDYHSTSLFGQTIEKGTFEITLRKPDLTQVKTKVTPQQ